MVLILAVRLEAEVLNVNGVAIQLSRQSSVSLDVVEVTFDGCYVRKIEDT